MMEYPAPITRIQELMQKVGIGVQRCFLSGILMMTFAAPTAQDASSNPSSWRDHFTSSRIEALREQLATGNTNTDTFWRDVEHEGTPLVEPSSPDAKHQVVTFLWRGSGDSRNVLVDLYPYSWDRAGDYVMRNVVGTDVWYLTTRLPRGARFAYRLSPNDPLENPSFGVLRNTKFQADPLNPNRWLCASTASLDRCYSRVELPGAVPQPWILRQAEIPGGTITTHQFKSDLLKNERGVSVYTPPGYQEDANGYPTLVLFDGGAYQGLIPTPVILDNLIAAKRIPPIVAVFVANVPGGRERELLFNRTFADCVGTELIPWIRAHYKISTDPQQVIVGGMSAGGAAATYIALLHSNVFGNVIAQSAGFNYSPAQVLDWQDRRPANDGSDRHVQEEVEDRSAVEGGWLAKQVIERPRLPIKFYLDAGLFEASLGGVIGILDATRHMRDVLLARGYEVHYQMFLGGHDYLSWRGTLSDGLIALIGTREP